jgi:hypothetical protein
MTQEERRGYDEAALGKPFDSTQPAEWQQGWHKFHDDMARSESARFV